MSPAGELQIALAQAGYQQQEADDLLLRYGEEIHRPNRSETKLAQIAALCDASDSEGDITVRAIRSLLDGGA